MASLHFAEERTFLAIIERSKPEWVALAIALQLGTHVAQGGSGDGVNDAPAMHAADASLSVDQAVDVAREAARAAETMVLSNGLMAGWHVRDREHRDHDE